MLKDMDAPLSPVLLSSAAHNRRLGIVSSNNDGIPLSSSSSIITFAMTSSTSDPSSSSSSSSSSAMVAAAAIQSVSQSSDGDAKQREIERAAEADRVVWSVRLDGPTAAVTTPEP